MFTVNWKSSGELREPSVLFRMNADRVGGETDRLHRLSDEAWNSISDLFPHSIGNKGFSQIIPSREVFEAVLYRARTGCPWRDLPKSYGPWHTIYMRWQRWVVRGVPNRVWKMLLEQKVDLGKLDLSLVILDSSVVRAHQHAAGAQKKRCSGIGPFSGRIFH